ncbi:TIGR02452 family protein [Aquisphaera giovannonii]|nr:TIGR02452 family protein [Aquisphaera giovannonii]
MRSTRAAMAAETVAIVERGSYRSASGTDIGLADAVRACLDGTRFLTPEHLDAIRREVLARPSDGLDTAIEVVNEATLAGASRLLAEGRGPVAALNFASARNPGGGFLKGSHAQEESLARSSALYASLLRAPEYYDRHRASPSLLYSDAMILSPACPVFRDDAGTLLDAPSSITFITSPAPNAGAIRDPRERARVGEVLRRRSELILALAASQGYRHLVLGAWGCGVFRNDPTEVASAFAAHLLDGPWSGRFERVAFSVLDTSASLATIAAFEDALARGR